MILIGDNLIPYTNFFNITSIDDIKNSKANSIISFRYNENILTYSFVNNIDCAVIISSIKEAIYANNLNAKYIVCEKNLAKNIQKIADNYMFDSKVLALIETSDEIEEIALNEIDGIIYNNLVN